MKGKDVEKISKVERKREDWREIEECCGKLRSAAAGTNHHTTF